MSTGDHMDPKHGYTQTCCIPFHGHTMWLERKSIFRLRDVLCNVLNMTQKPANHVNLAKRLEAILDSQAYALEAVEHISFIIELTGSLNQPST